MAAGKASVGFTVVVEAAAPLASVLAVIPSGKGVALGATVVVELGKVVVAV
jgi:hypothetical protein